VGKQHHRKRKKIKNKINCKYATRLSIGTVLIRGAAAINR